MEVIDNQIINIEANKFPTIKENSEFDGNNDAEISIERINSIKSLQQMRSNKRKEIDNSESTEISNSRGDNHDRIDNNVSPIAIINNDNTNNSELADNSEVVDNSGVAGNSEVADDNPMDMIHIAEVAGTAAIKAGMRKSPNNGRVIINNNNNNNSSNNPDDQNEWNIPTVDDGSRTGVEDYGFQRFMSNNPVRGDITKSQATKIMIKEVEKLKEKIIQDEEIEIQLESNLRRSSRNNNSRYRRANHVKVLNNIKSSFQKLAKEIPGFNDKELPTGNMSLSQAREYFDDLADKSVMEELIALVELQVFEGRYQHLLTVEERKRILRTHLLMKVKTDSKGTFQRLKSRLVCNGSIEIKDSFDKFELYSPTVGLQSIFLWLAIAAKEELYIKVIDIRTAYLTVDQDKDVTIFIRLDANMTEILVKKFPEYRKFVCPRTKTFVGILLKTMYGSINAAAMLYTKIHKKLISMKFIANGKDDCCFYKKVRGIRINVLAYVDDLCFSCSDKDIMNAIIKEFQEEFPEITIQENLDNCEYLGMRLEHE